MIADHIGTGNDGIGVAISSAHDQSITAQARGYQHA
jgi:hypothetical protein